MELENVKKEWINRQKEFWKNRGEIISEVEDGFIVDEKKRKWENLLYEQISTFIKGIEYLHCWSCRFWERSNIYYIDFMYNEKEFRFLFYEENKQVIWRTVCYFKEKEIYDEKFDHLSEKEIDKLYQKTKKLYKYICEFPLYRVKLALREVKIKESCSLFEKYESLMKEGN